MFVNKIPFLITISRHVKFGTVEVMKNRKSETIVAGLKHVKQLYAKRGFKLVGCHADNEFEPMRGDLAALGMELNVVSADEHVPEIERYIRTVKERTRCVYITVPFKAMPTRMIVEMVLSSVFWLNMFPPADGVSKTISPRGIIAGIHLDYTKHCQLEYGTYAQVHEEHDNSMSTRTTGAIALRPTGNEQGGHYFLSLTTGRKLNRNKWTELPMPAEVIARVNTLARRSQADRGLAFAWSDGTPIDDATDESDPDYDENDNNTDEHDSDGDTASDEYSATDELDEQIDDADNIVPDIADLSIAGVNNKDNENDDDNDPAGVEDEPAGVPAIMEDEPPDLPLPPAPPTEDAIIVETVTEAEPAGVTNKMEDSPTGVAAITGVTNKDKNEARMKQQYGDRPHEIPLRPRKPVDYSHLHATLEHTVLTQHSIKKGLKVFGEKGAEAVVTEMTQLHDRSVIEPKMSHMLTKEEKQKSLNYLMFLKQKRCGRIKARGCADGRKQRIYKTKQDTSAPTVAIESLFLSCVIDAKERRDVMTCDIPGAFMQANMDEVLYMRLEGPLAKL